MSQQRFLQALGVAAIGALTAFGCSGGDGSGNSGKSVSDTAASSEETKTRKGSDKQNKAAPELGKTVEEYSYSAVGKRDPFKSYLAELNEAKASKQQRKKQPTEEYKLDQYRLTGLVTGTSRPRAMVEDPNGRGHVVHIGTRLGKDGGIVTRITPTGIVVTEQFRAPTGEVVRVPIRVKLPESGLLGKSTEPRSRNQQ